MKSLSGVIEIVDQSAHLVKKAKIEVRQSEPVLSAWD